MEVKEEPLTEIRETGPLASVDDNPVDGWSRSYQQVRADWFDVRRNKRRFARPPTAVAAVPDLGTAPSSLSSTGGAGNAGDVTAKQRDATQPEGSQPPPPAAAAAAVAAPEAGEGGRLARALAAASRQQAPRRQDDDEDSSSSTTTAESAAYHTTFEANLPPSLTPGFLARHRPSAADLETMFKDEDVRALWALAQLTNAVEVTASAIQPSNADPHALCYSGSTSVISKLIAHLESTSPHLGAIDRCVAVGDQHKPRLPLHFVDDAQLASIPSPLLAPVAPPATAHSAAGSSSSSGNRSAEGGKAQLGPRVYEALWDWRGAHWLPLRHYLGYLQMVRVLPRHVYYRVHGPPRAAIDAPFEFLVCGLVYCATRESMLLQTRQGHELLRGLPREILVSRFEAALMTPQAAAALRSSAAAAAAAS